MALACLVLFAREAGAAEARAPAAPLFSVPVEYAGAAPLPAGTPLRLVLHARDAARLARTLGVAPPPAGAATLEYVLAEYPALASPQERTWLEPTWVVDFDEADVVALQRAFAAGHRARTSEAIVAYVAATIDESLDQGFEIASVVARRRAGDCTEHAVLAAALARASGLPARVTLGLAIVETDSGYAAYGHAWAEIREHGRWRIADAALVGLQKPVRYLPFGLLEDEGPGFTMGMAVLAQAWVTRVVVAAR